MKAGDTIRLSESSYRILGATPRSGSSFCEVWDTANEIGERVVIKFPAREIGAVDAEGEAAAEHLWTELGFFDRLRPAQPAHLVRLLDRGELNGLPVAVLERLDTDLKRLPAAADPGVAQVLDWGMQICAGLAVIHGTGYHYRDLKSSNILCDREGRQLKLADFGSVKPNDASGEHSCAGTVGFQAPEQAIPRIQIQGADGLWRVGFDTDHRSDFFSLGLLLFQWITGRRATVYGVVDAPSSFDSPAPPPGDGTGTRGIAEKDFAALRAATLKRLCDGEEPTLRPYGSSGPEQTADAVTRLLRRLLARNKAERPDSADEIREALAGIRQLLPGIREEMSIPTASNTALGTLPDQNDEGSPRSPRQDSEAEEGPPPPVQQVQHPGAPTGPGPVSTKALPRPPWVRWLLPTAAALAVGLALGVPAYSWFFPSMPDRTSYGDIPLDPTLPERSDIEPANPADEASGKAVAHREPPAEPVAIPDQATVSTANTSRLAEDPDTPVALPDSKSTPAQLDKTGGIAPVRPGTAASSGIPPVRDQQHAKGPVGRPVEEKKTTKPIGLDGIASRPLLPPPAVMQEPKERITGTTLPPSANQAPTAAPEVLNRMAPASAPATPGGRPDHTTMPAPTPSTGRESEPLQVDPPATDRAAPTVIAVTAPPTADVVSQPLRPQPEPKTAPTDKAPAGTLPLPEMVAVPGGSFTMGGRDGEPDEQPAHRVQIQPFTVSAREITSGEFTAFCRDTGRACDHPGDDPHLPAVSLSHADARAYAAWLGVKSGRPFRLPSEAEWEYLARRSPQTVIRTRGAALPPRDLPVDASRLAGLLGNVWEWVEDCAHVNYRGAPRDGSAWMASGGDCRRAVARGGSWFDPAEARRPGNRLVVSAATRLPQVGFRIAAGVR